MQRYAEDHQYAEVFYRAVQQRHPDHPFHTAEGKVEGADDGGNKGGHRQIHLQHRRDRRRAADVVADVHQQQGVDHDQRDNVLRRGAVLFGDRPGDGDFAGIIDALHQQQAEQRKADRRANH